VNNNFNSYLKRAFKIAYNVETILPLIFSSMILGMFFSALYDLIKKTIGDNIPTLLTILASTIFIVILAPIAIGLGLRQAAKAKSDPLLATKDNPKPHQGLILLVSRQQPCHVAIDFHGTTLKQCWLICSTKTLPEAQAIREFYRHKIVIDEPIAINDIYDPLEFVNEVNLIYTERLPNGWQESDIISDFSGMTANGSVGMALICYAKDRPLQYTPAVVDPETNRITGSANPIEIKLQ
jgi:hypothetical protein